MKRMLVFESVHFTIKADKLLKDFGVEYQIVPIPREISNDCGMSIEIDENDRERICELLRSQSFVFEVR